MLYETAEVVMRLAEIGGEVFADWYPCAQGEEGEMLPPPSAAQLAAAEVLYLVRCYGPMDPEIERDELRRLTVEYAALLNRHQAPAGSVIAA